MMISDGADTERALSSSQKDKLAKNGITSSVNDKKKPVENYIVAESRIRDGRSLHQINETMLQKQMDIQRKLEAHIEVQMHLQLRIEAQRKYLQSVLSKASEIIANEVSIGCLSSSFSHGGLIHEKTQNDDFLFDSCSASEKINVNSQKTEACFSSLLTEEVDEINPENCKAG